MKTDIDLNKPIWQLTVGEFLQLLEQRQPIVLKETEMPQKRLVYGIAGIAQLLNCSMTTANRIKASGKINRAISQCGRMITVDADLALELMKQPK
ncbi:MAG: DUF3853 family protein [Paludibacter sp.]|nr:DUF3853 family protein [Paludibacter sp.]